MHTVLEDPDAGVWGDSPFIKGEANVSTNDFRRIPMAHHTHQLVDKTL